MTRKGKLPGFVFFAPDWLAEPEVRALSAAQRGYYIDLLALCFQENGLPPRDATYFWRVLGLGVFEFQPQCQRDLLGGILPQEGEDGQLSSLEHVLDTFFHVEANGKRWNPKLLAIVQEQDAKSRARAKSGRLGGKKRKQTVSKSQANGSIPSTSTSTSTEEEEPERRASAPRAGGRITFNLPHDLETPAIREALADWRDVRLRKKKPLTQLAADRAMKKLAQLSHEHPDTALAIVNASVDHAWDSFYPLSDPSRNGSSGNRKLDWMKNVEIVPNREDVP